MSKKKLSLLIGAAAGAVLGMMFAPTKGKELREKIKKAREKGDSGIDVIKDHAKKVQNELVDTYNKVKENPTTKKLTAKVKKTFDDLATLSEEDFDNLKEEKEKVKPAKSKILKKKK
ncbi:hypothetical protein A2483_02720 [Candidatus Peregrinibacteria bacterium RIFOXYC2_FULL_33_13]|nr:MAG: hypothetical protein UR27_C0010G0018 [Candidatus Peregrinibacteria bacterium GW2011_GWA2_33_10]KKP41207.1 MAG: hypothetical protein UR30_C0001G0054 [Candidatus Peregrinibacteria bacterium GW2011_GWC2_33_13]OGJ49335.1 MAG: hypothetical protein A2229_03190 [Candidatus Peregrinibacteria bacterium RIFOXYA2_FULL_33_7]OGJ54531.1 MAG: hypothetical protein A2483_02720 [Candidatus Peregrinibacteria bacterium RIFOXYC2_FULL_33_13]